MTRSLPSISVVIPTYNRVPVLQQCLEALAAQDYAGLWQVIVVDDGSTDKTPDVICAFSGFVHLRQENRGPAAARNRGIQEASGEIIAFTDDDCLAPADWLSRLADGYIRYPQIAGAGGYLEAPERILRENRIAQFERSVGRDEYGTGNDEVVGGFECPAGGTNNMSYRRDVLLEIGGFDETFPFAAGEDADLKLRICQGGASLLYLPVKMIHLQPYAREAFRRQYLVRGRGVVHFERKHQGHPPTVTRVLLRLTKRVLWLAYDLVAGPDRHLAFTRFAARWYDGVGQLGELQKLKREADHAGDD